MVGRAVFILILIFVLNFVFVGLNLSTPSDLNTVSPMSQGISDFGNNTDKITMNVVTSTPGGQVSDSEPRVLPDSGVTYDYSNYIKQNIFDLPNNYKNTFINAHFPESIAYLFTGIITIICMFCIFIIGSAVVSTFTGGSGI